MQKAKQAAQPHPPPKVPPCVLRSLARRSKGSHSCERPAQPPPARASRMASSASRLGPASRTSVARLRPAESDVRGMPSTRSKTVGAVRQVRGSAEVGFWVVCWVAHGGARQLAAAGSSSGAAERGRGAVYRASPWTGGVWRLFGPAHSPGAGFKPCAVWCLPWCAGWASGELLRAHYADLPRLAHTRAMAAFAPALIPMLTTPPARVFAATNMLVCVLLLLLLCAERFFPLCSGRSRGLRSCRATGAGHRNGDCGGPVGHLGELWVMV